MDYILVAKSTSRGITGYWTGNAGGTWISLDRARAFHVGPTYAAAKANQFNIFSKVHGFTFSVIPA